MKFLRVEPGELRVLGEREKLGDIKAPPTHPPIPKRAHGATHTWGGRQAASVCWSGLGTPWEVSGSGSAALGRPGLKVTRGISPGVGRGRCWNTVAEWEAQNPQSCGHPVRSLRELPKRGVIGGSRGALGISCEGPTGRVSRCGTRGQGKGRVSPVWGTPAPCAPGDRCADDFGARRYRTRRGKAEGSFHARTPGWRRALHRGEGPARAFSSRKRRVVYGVVSGGAVQWAGVSKGLLEKGSASVPGMQSRELCGVQGRAPGGSCAWSGVCPCP